MRCVAIVLGLIGCLTMTERILPFDNFASAAGYDRPGGNPRQSRSMIIAEHGIVATSQPLAAQAGLDILKRGGNAADAAIATSAAMGVVEPMSCGIGGDLFVIYWDAKTQKLYGLNASGRSPYALNRDVFKKLKLNEIPDQGPLSWSVPGCVSGYADLSNKFGTLPLGAVLKPAIDLAADGFPVSEIIAADWNASAARLQPWTYSAKTFLPSGRAPQVGEIFRNPALAASLSAVSKDGIKAFYDGPIAEKIVAFSESNGGYFSRRDFAEHTNEWVDPVSTSYRGYDVWELPPNGQGIAALQMLNILEAYDLHKMGFGSAAYIHRLIEAKKLAFADRAKFYADPAFNKLPTAELISKAYADKRRALLSDRALTDVPAGDPKLEHGDTIYLTVVDKDRNCCSLIQSNFYGFGSQVVAGDVGFPMQNRGALFALDPKHLNTLEPHKRPFHTIIPAMVTKDGKPWLCFGVMGGDMQAQGHVQILVNMIDFGMNVQEAGDAARVRHSGSATPTGGRGDSAGGSVAVESGISDEVIEALRKAGHQVVRSRGGYGGYQAIQIDWERGTLRGATEVRKDGAAVGY